MSPSRRRLWVERVAQTYHVSERRACQVLSQPRATQRWGPAGRDGEVALVEAIVALARKHGRYGYRRVTAMLRREGWWVNHKRVERLWRQEGLKVPSKQPKRGRLWLRDGSSIRIRPLHRNHVWAYDFIMTRTEDGRPVSMLAVIDEYTRECLAIRPGRHFRSDDVVACLADLFISHGVPEHVRSDNGPESTATVVREWLGHIGARTLFIEPGSPWENGYVESFNGKLRDELLDREVFYTLKELEVAVEQWRRDYNQVRPHSALGYRPPAPEAILANDLLPALAGLT